MQHSTLEEVSARVAAGERSRALDAAVEEVAAGGTRHGMASGVVRLYGHEEYQAPAHTTGTAADRDNAVALMAGAARPDDATIALMRPVPRFQAEGAPVARRMAGAPHAIGGWSSPQDIVERTPMRHATYASLFAYLHRRFGPPWMPGDGYKDLSAGWLLTTPDPHVVVRIVPHVGHPSLGVNAYAALANPGERHRPWDQPPVERWPAIRAAVSATLVDLLRPVCIRDNWIDALGTCEEPEDPEDEAPTGRPGAEYHPSCGWAMPLGLFGSAEWASLHDAIHVRSPDDARGGLRTLLADAAAAREALNGKPDDTGGNKEPNTPVEAPSGTR